MFKVFSDDIKAITIFVSRGFFFFLHRAIADFAAIDISAVSCFRLAYFLLIKEVLEHGYEYSTFIKTQLLDACVNFCIWHSSTRYSLWWKWPNRTAKILTLCILFTHSTVWPETRYWGHLITEVLPLMPNYTYQLGRVLISLDKFDNLVIKQQ